jgi:phenylalanyl-tRNA synthetase beta chain
MKFPESWLREWCNPPLSSQALADTLTMGGFEVESMVPVAPPFSGVVVGEIMEAEQHPNADKLRICKVSAGAHTRDGLLQIVCGAPNARVGIRVPVALVGAVLPPATADAEPFNIKAATLRGIASSGMLCSARELGLSTDHGGLLELGDQVTVGADLRQALALDDQVLELKLTPNLGHALSVYGVARELSALTGAPLKQPTFKPAAVAHDAVLPVRIEAPDLCGRFTGRIVRNVNPKATTPAWMVERLARCGQRSVNALVDISNYVMFEFGRPSHIFDLDKINAELVVRWARAGESLKLLNGQTVELDAKVGVIADAQAVESLAGIMGGDATATSDSTRNVYVEAAFWYPEAVAGRSRRFAFNTDAGHRFERGVDPSTTIDHVEHITQLMQSICGGEAGPISDQQPAMPQAKPLRLRAARASRIIGMPISVAQCADVMQRLGFTFTQDSDSVTVTPPAWRFDLRIEADLVEEVARVLGFEHLPNTPPESKITPKALSESRRSVHALRHRVAALGYQETINYSFVEASWERDLAGNADPIRVLNPIAAPMSVMRSSLMGSLLQALQRNVVRRATRVRLFEVGRVYRRDASVTDGDLSVAGVAQPMHVGGLAWGEAAPTQWGQPAKAVDFYDVKGDVQALFAPHHLTFIQDAHPALHPGRSARVQCGGVDVGWLGELHPRWRQSFELPTAPILFEMTLASLLERTLPQAQALARQQPVWRDIALVADGHVTHDALMQALRQAGGALLRQVTLFDVYKPKEPAADMAANERSLAVRLELQDDEQPLTDERVDAAMAGIVGSVSQALGVRLRV